MNMLQRLYLVTFLTCVRIPLVLLFFVGALVDSIGRGRHPWLFAASLTCLIAAAVSDLLDGYCARKLGVTTKLGACADPLSDKVFYLATLPLLVFITCRNDHVTHAVVLLCFTVLLLLRDQWVSFLRAIGASCQSVNLSANWSGKLRTGLNFPLICFIYLHEGAANPCFSVVWLYILEAAALVVNFVSFYVYTRDYWPHLKKAFDVRH